jgi:hypothetical protein
VGFKFSLVLSREVTDEESVLLKETSCADTSFESDTLPTNAEIPVTKMGFDDSSSPTLAEAIEAGFDAVKKIDDLGIPGLIVPAQPAEKPGAETESGAPEVVDAEVVDADVVKVASSD